MRYPERVEIVEVGPRDGLQSEPRTLADTEKVALIEALADAGVRRFEAGSFVSPQAIPQLADTEAVVAALRPREGVVYGAHRLHARLDRDLVVAR